MANAHVWYHPDFHVAQRCKAPFWGEGCDGYEYETEQDCDCSCHLDSAPEFVTNEDVTRYHGKPEPREL